MSDKRRTVFSFIFGVVFGAAIAAAGSHFYSFHCKKDFSPGEWKGRRQGKFLSKMRSKLSLSSKQDKKIEKILEEKRKSIEALREKIRPEFHKIREDARVQIRAVLSAEQRPHFDQVAAERKKYWEEKIGPKPK